LIEAALNNPDQNKFINRTELEKYRNFGGVSTNSTVHKFIKVTWTNCIT